MGSSRTVLVTGGAGFIGSHTCLALAKVGLTPVTYDNLERGFADSVKWGPLVVGDLLDKNLLSATIKQYSPAAILHFAAYAYVGESTKDPISYYRNNVCGSVSLLEAAVENKVEKIVFSSTCATYGHPKHLPINEKHPQAPVNPYGMSKLMVENIIKDVASSGQIRYVILRYFNASGSDPELRIGERHAPETHLIPLAIDAALGRIPYLSVYGNDYDTPDGTCIRDYIHVADLADAHVKALQYLDSEGESNVFNLGNGNGATVYEIIKIVERVVGKKVPLKIDQRRLGDPSKLIGDPAFAQSVLHWHAQHSAIEKQVKDAFSWRSKVV